MSCSTTRSTIICSVSDSKSLPLRVHAVGESRIVAWINNQSIVVQQRNHMMLITDSHGLVVYTGCPVVRNTSCAYQFTSPLINCQQPYQPYYIMVGSGGVCSGCDNVVQIQSWTFSDTGPNLLYASQSAGRSYCDGDLNRQ
ncbi:unnamed protein product [Sphagnum balticum]